MEDASHNSENLDFRRSRDNEATIATPPSAASFLASPPSTQQHTAESSLSSPAHVTFDEVTSTTSVEAVASSSTLETPEIRPRSRAASWEEDSVAEMDYVRGSLKTPSAVPPHKRPSLSPLTDGTKPSRPLTSPDDTLTCPPVSSSRNSRTPLAFEVKGNHEEGSLYVPPSDLAGLAAGKQPLVIEEGHQPLALPKFEDVQTCMWTASHAANCPSEDRSASLVNVLLQPMPDGLDNETQLPNLEAPDYRTLIRLNLWGVVDGHGGGCVASYVSEVLLPHICLSVARALGCAILDRGVCTVNGQRRDANALDFDGLIQSTWERIPGNPNSIQYRSPFERSDSEEEGQHRRRTTNANTGSAATRVSGRGDGGGGCGATVSGGGGRPLAATDTAGTNAERESEQASSCKTSVKTAASPATREELVGTHAPKEVASITRAITESFLAVDEGWINSIDPVATHQTSCQSNGRWNSGACALVVFTIQRLDWTSVSEPGREMEPRDPEKSRLNTCQNRDAARRRMLDYASRTKSDGTMSTGSSTSSLTTEEAVHASGIESEITETEGEDDARTSGCDNKNRDPVESSSRTTRGTRESFISPPGACSCHCYRAHDAMIYTAHVGDCRAVMLGSAPPRTIKVGDFLKGETDTTDDESSHHSSDETECLSSSDHDADTSEDEDVDGHRKQAEEIKTEEPSNFIALRPRRVARSKGSRQDAPDDADGPFNALPPLGGAVGIDANTTELYEKERKDARQGQDADVSDSSSCSQDSIDLLPLLQLPPSTGPIDLTTDHSAYNPAEVTAVLRRCNNAPRAISSGMGGGIKRVAGSLAVTRALGDAYLKTPKLSFNPYKRHAPYITARPEVNCRPLVKNGDKVLILATDGVWERASGEDVLRWVRNFYEERVAEAERRRSKRMSKSQSSNDDSGDVVAAATVQGTAQSKSTANPEGSERDLFEKSEPEKAELEKAELEKAELEKAELEKEKTILEKVEPEKAEPEASASRKREADSSPVGHTAVKRRKRSRSNRLTYNVADVIVRRVLNKVRRARNISTLQALMSLPQGRARRSKHDDITASVVDLSAFVS